MKTFLNNQKIKLIPPASYNDFLTDLNEKVDVFNSFFANLYIYRERGRKRERERERETERDRERQRERGRRNKMIYKQ